MPPALDRLALQLAAATGAQSDRMIRDHGWRFLTVGRLLERLVGLTQCLDDFLEAGALGGADGVEALLDLFDSTISYRARYQRHEDLLALVDLLVLDDTNPRAFAGVLRRLRTELSKLPGSKQVLAPMQSWLPRVGVGFALRDLRDLDDTGLVRILLEVARRLNRMALSLGEDTGVRLGQEVSIAVDSYPDQVFKGQVMDIADEAEFTPRNVQTVEGRKSTVYAVKISVPNADQSLKPGMPADVDFNLP